MYTDTYICTYVYTSMRFALDDVYTYVHIYVYVYIHVHVNNFFINLYVYT